MERVEVQTIRVENQTLGFTISRGSLYSILFYCTIEKCHFSNIFYISKGHYEIKFMSRKISISKNKFYQEIPKEKMRYLKQRSGVNTTLLDWGESFEQIFSDHNSLLFVHRVGRKVKKNFHRHFFKIYNFMVSSHWSICNIEITTCWLEVFIM